MPRCSHLQSRDDGGTHPSREVVSIKCADTALCGSGSCGVTHALRVGAVLTSSLSISSDAFPRTKGSVYTSEGQMHLGKFILDNYKGIRILMASFFPSPCNHFS